MLFHETSFSVGNNEIQFNLIYGKRTSTENDSLIIRTLLDDSQAHASAENLFRDYIYDANKVIDSTSITTEHKNILHGLTEFLNLQ